MKTTVTNAPSPQSGSSARRPLLASRRHTLIFLAICLAVTVLSTLSAHRVAAPNAPAVSSQILQIYLLLIGMEWLWVRFVYKGMQAYGRSLFEFIGYRKFEWRQLAADLAYAALALAFSYVWFVGMHRLSQSGEAASNPLLPAVPNGAVLVIAWIGLSLSAGICEEIVFRGYLQRQLAALSGSTTLAIIGQAIVFGIAHGYEGTGAVFRIMVYGVVFGALAAWRGNIRAGVLAHATWDILAGLGVA